MIDLRSDTVTKPSQEMLDFMFKAEVGDDVYSEDPSINKFEKMLADYFGMEAGIFCPSGTMCNQIAIKLLTEPQDEVICDQRSHIYRYEGGGIFSNSLVSVKLLDCNYGILDAESVEGAINPEDVHLPKTSLISLENTCNKGGGSFYSLEQIEGIREIALKNDLQMHLDGARVFNALIASGVNPKDLGKNFVTISICFSKGMGCPVGSVLLCSKKNEFKARRIRKSFGGGMRQAGYLAAAGIYALENNILRLNDDHSRVQKIADEFDSLSYIKKVFPHPTNILLFSLENEKEASRFSKYLKENRILISAFDSNVLRIVTHLNFDDDQLLSFIDHVRNFN